MCVNSNGYKFGFKNTDTRHWKRIGWSTKPEKIIKLLNEQIEKHQQKIKDKDAFRMSIGGKRKSPRKTHRRRKKTHPKKSNKKSYRKRRKSRKSKKKKSKK